MLLSRIELQTDSVIPSQVARRTMYGAHQLIWSFFSGAQNRDFLFRVEQGGPGFQAFTLSRREPRADSEIWNIQTKEFDPQLRKGELLHFSIRVNPVIRASSGPGRGKRHDVVMHAKTHADPHDRARTTTSLIQRCGAEWLEKRSLLHGFSLIGEGEPAESVIASQYMRRPMRKAGSSAPIVVTTLNLSGRLRIEDVTTFRKTLFEGLGPAKGFGCGLMMIKRAT